MVISLIGYRGTGKTTVGAELAARLGWDFVDTDPEIERRAGKSIAALFAEEGEPYFRQLESQVLADQLARDQLVISAGGGAVLNAQNRAAIRQAGPVVWLQATVETISNRIGADPTTGSRRPALLGGDVLAEITAVLAQREPLYREIASVTVATDNRSVPEIVDQILEQIPVLED